MKTPGEDNISVFLRVRPFNDKQQTTDTIVHTLTQKSIKVKDKQSINEFTFDGIFHQKSTQYQVYEKVGKDVVQFAFEGFNGTIFAYGQTSSGKTFTCIGPQYEDEIKKGILPRLVSQIFTKITEEPPYIEFRIKISMVEIYLEKIKDLLDISKTDVKIRQNKSKGIYLQDITEEYVASTAQAHRIFEKGIANRTVAQTNMNDVSSRSHMAFILTLHQNNLKDASAKSGKIILVDLAGSEKVSKTQAEGKVLDEAKQINKSLSSLGNVINALTDTKLAHIPYRDSKLTRLLQQSLGGNSKTRLIINISPSSYNYSESLSSLRFGFRAKQIKNKPRINRQYTVAQLLILLEKAQKRIQQLEKILVEFTSSKKKSKVKSPSFIENLLDSDNPIMSGLSQTQGEQEPQFFRKQLSGIKENKFQSQAQSDEEPQCRSASKSQKSQKSPSKEKYQFDKQRQQWYIERQQLLETIRDLTFDKNEGYRQIQLFQQKYEIAAKQARILSSKLNSSQSQNQKLLQKVIGTKLQTQQQQLQISELKRQLTAYEQSIAEMIKFQSTTRVSRVFGIPQTQGKEMNKLIEKYQMFHEMEKERIAFQEQINVNSNQIIKMEQDNVGELKRKIRQLQSQIAMFKNLQQTKEKLIQQRMSFVKEKERVYKDLENRIQKVCELQELLDQSKEKNKILQDIINSDQSEKGRKILSQKKHIDELSQSYYVLKGQQSSWINNNKRYEKKIQGKDIKIKDLEKQIIELKGEIQALKMNENKSDDDFKSLDFEGVQDSPFSKKGSKIVKVVRSSQIFV